MNVRKMTFLSLSVALALLLSFVESQIPPFVAVPGIKIGLSNIVTVYLLYAFSWREAGAVSLVRVLLSSLLFGTAVSLIYSLAGAVLSFLVMLLLKKLPIFSSLGVSIAGGVMHNLGQIIAACLLLENAVILGYLPVLIVSGVVAGIAVGVASAIVVKRVKIKL